jgi:dTDP-4-amino-4,6-dideoxygalactose transaminase
MIALGLGPGDEVLIPAHTYMATATAVLTTGAIPVIVDIDESLTVSPDAIEAAIGPRTRALVAVHMWGAACDMDRLHEIARRHRLFLIEDACQGVGGGYEGRKLGAIGDIGAFSFNYFKNMTCGEGGGLATSEDRIAHRARCAIDPCHFYWTGRDHDADSDDSMRPFAGNGGRASELAGAMLNVQLDRIDDIVAAMRSERRRIISESERWSNLGLKTTPMNSEAYDCAAHLMYLLPDAAAARSFVSVFPGVIAGKTGRHTYTEWDQVLMGAGAAHPAMNPYNHPDNAACRKSYSKEMCRRSLDILERTVMIPMHPNHQHDEVTRMIKNIGIAAQVALNGAAVQNFEVEPLGVLDRQKFDAQDG